MGYLFSDDTHISVSRNPYLVLYLKEFIQKSEIFL